MNIGGLASGLGAFANGYADAKEKVRKQKMEDARFEMEQKRLGLEMDRAEREKKMADELQGVNVPPKVEKLYTVVGPEGEVIYADAKMAQEHYARAAQTDPEGAKLSEGFSVAGQRFESAHDAKFAVEAMTTPAAIARRQAEIASRYNNPQLAGAYMDNYRKQVASNREDAQRKFQTLRGADAIEKAADLYTDQLADGMDAKVERGQDGSVTIRKFKEGKEVGAPQVFPSADAFWDGHKKEDGTFSPGLMHNVMNAPENYMEMWKTNVGLAMEERKLRSQEKVSDAQVKQINAETAEMPKRTAIAQMGAQASLVGAGAAARNAGVNEQELGLRRTEMERPKIYGGIDPETSEAVYTGVRPVQDKTTGAWSTEVLPTKAAKGLVVPGMAIAKEKNAMPGMGTPQKVDFMELLNSLPKKNLPPAK